MADGQDGVRELRPDGDVAVGVMDLILILILVLILGGGGGGVGVMGGIDVDAVDGCAVGSEDLGGCEADAGRAACEVNCLATFHIYIEVILYRWAFRHVWILSNTNDSPVMTATLPFREGMDALVMLREVIFGSVSSVSDESVFSAQV